MIRPDYATLEQARSRQVRHNRLSKAVYGYRLARTRQKLFKEGKDFLPAVLCLLRPIVRAVPRKECVSRAVVTVEFVVLAEPLQRRFRAVHMFWRRVGVFIPHQPDERAADSFCQTARR